MSSSEHERTLPHSLEAERSVIGCCLVNPKAFDAARLTASQFWRHAHRDIWDAITTLAHAEAPIDYVTLAEELRRMGKLEECGGPAYVSSLGDGVPRATNIRYYADIVREKAGLREIIYVCNDVLAKAYEGDEPREVLRDADKQLLRLGRDALGRVAAVKDGTTALFEDLSYRSDHRGMLMGVDTGFQRINELTLGWTPGDLIVIAARPSIGKTAFALNSALVSAQAGKRVVFFSFEMRRRQLEYRILSTLSRVSSSRLRSGHLSSQDFGPIREALDRMHGCEMLIDDQAGQSVWDIRSTCRRVAADQGLDLVVIDYVQLIPGSLERRGATRNDEITDISRRLKVMADELNVPVLLLSQLSRANDRREDPRPKLSDLRDSGALEQDADVVCFLHRGNHREVGPTLFAVEKQRNGPTGTTTVTLDGDTTTFTDGGEEPPAPPAEPEQPRRARAPRRFAPEKTLIND